MCVLIYTLIAGQFAKVYGGAMDDEAFKFIATDNGFLITGSTWSYTQGNDDYLILSVDSAGNILWSEAVGDTGAELGFSVISKGQNYLIAGSSTSYGAGYWDVFLAEIDPQGSFQWVKTYGGADADGATFITDVSDGGYLLVGGTRSWAQGGNDILVIKLDANMDVQWAESMGGTGDEGAVSAAEMSDGYVLAGLGSSWGAGFDDMVVVKLSTDGSLSWAKAYGGTWDDTAYTVIPVGDSLLMAGVTSSFGSGNLDIIIAKLAPSGDVIWAKTYGGAEFDKLFSCKPTSDGGYIVAGATESFWGQDDDLLLMKLDHDGAVEWVRGLGGDNSDFGMDVCETNNGYAMIGGMSSYGAGEWDYFLMTLDDNGNYSGCVMDTVITPVDITGLTITDISLDLTDITSNIEVDDTTLSPRPVSLESSDVCPPAVRESSNPITNNQIWASLWSGGAVFHSSFPVSLSVYTPDGRLYLSQTLSRGGTRISLAPGVYFWKAETYRGKVVIR